MKQKILVTGGAGYIGSILVPELIFAGYEVSVIDKFIYQQNSLAHICFDSSLKIINGDVRDQELMTSLLAKHDVIIPLAALVGAPLCKSDPIAATSTNKDAILWMLSKLSSQQTVLMPTTNSAYGKGGENNYCDESSPLFPMSLYAKDKVEVERALMSHSKAISFRLATVFGMSPRMRIDLLVNDFVYRAVYDRSIVLFEGHFKRNYIHIKDVASAFLFGLENQDKMFGQIYNIGLTEANLSKLELCQKIKKYIPDLVVMEAGIGQDPDQRDYLVSNLKIESIGYSPKFSLDAGICELIKGYQMIKNTKYGNI